MPYIQIGPDTYCSNDPKNEVSRLPAGVYNSGRSVSGTPVLHHQDVKKDELIFLPGTGSRSVLEEIRKFWNRRERYRELGAVHKRGILLAGPPGCGKTSTVAFLVDDFLAEFDGIVINIHDVDFVRSGLSIVRGVEPERPIMVLIEDFEDALKRGSESAFLNVVDGRDQIDGVVFVATTNHLDQLPPRIINRPSRFDLVVSVGMPGADARRAYLRAKSKMDDATIDRIVAGSEQWGIAHLKEAAILVEVYDHDVDAAINRMNKLMGRKMSPKDVETKPPLGTVEQALEKGSFRVSLVESTEDGLLEAYKRALGEVSEDEEGES